MSDIIPNVVVSMPSQLFTLAKKFQAASNGKIFIGKIDTDPTLPENQIQVYLENEDGSHIPVSQPLIINQAGFPVYNGQISKFVTVEGHSMAVYDSHGAQQHYYPNILKYDPDQLRGDLLSEHGGDNVFVGNTSISSIITKTKYTRIGNFIDGCTVNSDLECVKFGDFYYAVRNRDSLPIFVSPNSSPDESWICVGDANFGYESHSIFNFGGVDDNGITDNREAIQLAIEYMEFSGSLLFTNSSHDDRYFGINSFNPDADGKHCLIIRKLRNVNIFGGRDRNSSIRYTGGIEGESLIKIECGRSDWGARIESLGVSGGNKLNYVLFSNDFWYANSLFIGGCFEDAILDGIHVSMYMTSFIRVLSNNNGRDGFSFGGPNSEGGWIKGTSTSLNMLNCWARACKRFGYKVSNELWYSNWSSNGCDGVGERTEIAYFFDIVKGVSLASNGAEFVEQYLKVNTFRGLNVSGIQVANLKSSKAVDRYLIELSSGFNASFSGYAPYNQFDDQYDYIVYVTNPSGNEFVLFLDDSIPSYAIGHAVLDSGKYYRYPKIIHYAVSDTRDRGFDRFGSSLSVPKDVNMVNSSTSIPDGFITRKINVRNISIEKNILSISGANCEVLIKIISTDYNSKQSSSEYILTKVNGTSIFKKVNSSGNDDYFVLSYSQNNIYLSSSSSRNFFIIEFLFSSPDNTACIFNI
ncbi:hypothetical protein PROTEUSMB838_19050 [Proteus sp. MB838]